MNRVRQWTVQRPRWAIVLSAGVMLACVLALVYVVAPFVVVAPLVVVALLVGAISLLVVCFAVLSLRAYFSGKPLFHRQAQVALEFEGERQWVLVDAAARRPMQLTHAWPAFAWVRLRFRAARETGSKDTMLELTIWKDSVSCQAWRELRVLLARQAALRQWRAQKGGW
ncbi:MAG: protein YgfX [Paralcaligenes sp.]